MSNQASEDDELREILSPEFLDSAGAKEEHFYPALNRWRKKHELQARLDELDYIYAAGNPVHTAIDGEKVHIFDRMEALKQELEKL